MALYYCNFEMLHKRPLKAFSFTNFNHGLHLLNYIKKEFNFKFKSNTYIYKEKTTVIKYCPVNKNWRNAIVVSKIACVIYSFGYLINIFPCKAHSIVLIYFVILTHKPRYMMLSLILLKTSWIAHNIYAIDCLICVFLHQLIHKRFDSLLM